MVRRGGLGRGLAVLVLWPALAAAQSNFWLTDTGGSFGDPGNWSLGVPMPDPTPTFNLHSPGYHVYLDHTYTTTALNVRDDSVSLNLGGFRYDLLLFDQSVLVGRDAGDSGYLALSGGVLSGYAGTLGRDAGSSGTVVVAAGPSGRICGI